MQDIHSIVAELTSVRKAWRLGHKDVSQRSGLSVETIGAMERGEASPRLRTLALLADALGYELVLKPKGSS